MKNSPRHIIEYAALRAAISLLNLLPLRLALMKGAALGRMAWFLGIRRKVSLINLRQAFPEKPAAWHRRTGAASYANAGRFMVEFARQPRLGSAYFEKYISLAGEENRARMAAEGGIGLSFHFGNWEFLGVSFKLAGIDTSFLVGEQHNKMVDKLINDLRASRGIRLVTRDGSMREIFRAIREKRTVCWLSDQDAGRNGILVDFLGRPASTPRGAAAFAVKLGCGVYPIFLVRDRGPRQTVVCSEPIHARKDLPPAEAEVDVTRRYTQCLEEMIRKRPDLYWWPHRRWKSTGLYGGEASKGKNDGQEQGGCTPDKA